MKVLAIDTATSRQSVAVLEDETVLARADQDAHGTHGKLLIPTIQRVLLSRQLTLADLDGLVVSIGPGSFTGLRVGLATMLGFRMVTGLPLVGVPTLEGLAWNLRGHGRPICPVLRARTGELYWALYHWSGRATTSAPECLGEPRVDSPDRLAAAIVQPIIVVGEGWWAYGQDIRQRLGQRKAGQGAGDLEELIEEAPTEAMWPSAVSVGVAAYPRFARGEIAGPGLSPLYVQRAEAEVKWEANQRQRDGHPSNLGVP